MSDKSLEGEFAAFRAAGETASLLDAALLVARGETPQLDEGPVRDRIDALGREAGPHLGENDSLETRVAGLCHFLAEVCGFHGADSDYYRYENSQIGHVLDTRRGIPITLAVIYASVAQRLGLDCEGVNFPGHFLVRARLSPGDETVSLIDPFIGRAVTAAECESRLQAAAGRSLRLSREHLRRAAPQDVLVRMLNNLKQIALADADALRALRYSQRILWVNPDALLEHRDRALMLEQIGHYDEAIEALKELTAGIDDASLLEWGRRRIEVLRLRAAEPRTLH